MEPILVRDIFAQAFDNRTFYLRHRVFPDIEKNQFEIEIQPEGYIYRVRFLDFVSSEGSVFSYLIYRNDDLRRVLLFKVGEDEFAQRRKKEGIRILAYFHLIIQEEGRLSGKYYIPLLMEREGELLIEPRVHDILLNTEPEIVPEKIIQFLFDLEKQMKEEAP
ncbi:hypothetical protein [Persephonella sp. KM09-Lau-8]|uniref:hypothetical protein n=1 Tax=Persephonella sp. KM09-Lau-8 TaxID=1158345 RepID=UPI000495A8D1|nr:hypothetical protein [Persephonella sp. KM09-Lau-8]